MSGQCSVTLILTLATALVASLHLEVSPSGFSLIPEDTNMTLTLTLQYNDTSDPMYSELMSPGTEMTVVVVPDEEWKLDFVNNRVCFTPDDVGEEGNKSIVLSGYYWGRTQLSFYLFIEQINQSYVSDALALNGSLLRDDIFIGVNRAFSVLDTIFMVSIGTLVFINSINMGAQLNLSVIKECLRKPLGPLCGFLSQFGFMPPFSFWMGYLFFTNPLFRLGLFTLGCSPGGMMSNLWTLIYDGDINLSITMTFISTLAAMGMMPLWMFTLGRRIVQDNENLQIPFKNLAISLISLTVPLGLGLLIQYKRPKWAKKIGRFTKPFTLGTLLFLLALGLYNSWKILLLMTKEIYIAGYLVAISGFLFGAIFSGAFCLKKSQIIAISIETAMQNIGAAYVVLKLSLPSPDGDIGSLPLIAQGLLTGVSLQGFFWISTAIKRLLKCCSSQAKHSKDVEGIKEEADVTKALMDEEGFNKKKKKKVAISVTSQPQARARNGFQTRGQSPPSTSSSPQAPIIDEEEPRMELH